MSEIKEKVWNSNYTKVWVANFMLFFSFMLLTPLLPIYLNETFHADKQMIGLVLSGYVLTALIVRPFSGFIVDSFPRKTVLLICYFLFFALFAGYFVAGSLLTFAIVRTLHGAPFGATTVSSSTIAIDVLPSSRRAEGIGYYGLSNNIATAIGPSIAIYIYNEFHNFDILFAMSLFFSFVGLIINSTVKTRDRELVREKRTISLDRFFLLTGWAQSLSMICFAFSYSVLATYLAIYGKEELGILGGTGTFFMLFAFGLILSRLVGTRSLRKGRITQNAAMGMLLSLCGYVLFAAVRNEIGYYGAALIIGLGNGHMFPAFQTMFINLAEHNQRGTANSTLLTSWDVGVGIGILCGGVVAESLGYHTAFWIACAVNFVGVMFYFVYGLRYFKRHSLHNIA